MLGWNRFQGGLLLAGVGLKLIFGGASGRLSADAIDGVSFRGILPAEIQSEAAIYETGRLPVPRNLDSSAEESVQGLLRVAAVAINNKNFVSAKVSLNRVLELQPENVPALLNSGWVAQRESDWAGAEEYFSRAQRLLPKSAAVWMGVGISVLEQGKLDHALGAFAQVIAFEPKNARGRRLLGLTLARKGWFAPAEEELRRSLEFEPDDPGAHFNLAVVYLQRKPVAVEMARRHYYRAIDLGAAPDDSVEGFLSGSISSDSSKSASSPSPSSASPPSVSIRAEFGGESSSRDSSSPR